MQRSGWCGTLAHYVTQLSRLLSWVSAFVLVAAVIAGFSDVVSTFLAGGSVPGVYEGTELALVLIVFLAQAYVIADNAHIRLDLVTFRPGSGASLAVTLLTHLLMLLCFGVLAKAAYSGWVDSLRTLEQSQGLISIPVYPVRLGLFVGLLMAFLQSLASLVLRLLGEGDDAPTQEII